jgi:hypothetical protein
MDFSEALYALKDGQRVARTGWNGRGMWIAYEPIGTSNMSLPYIYISSADDYLAPWTPSQTDLAADDWVLVDTD